MQNGCCSVNRTRKYRCVYWNFQIRIVHRIQNEFMKRNGIDSFQQSTIRCIQHLKSKKSFIECYSKCSRSVYRASNDNNAEWKRFTFQFFATFDDSFNELIRYLCNSNVHVAFWFRFFFWFGISSLVPLMVDGRWAIVWKTKWYRTPNRKASFSIVTKPTIGNNQCPWRCSVECRMQNTECEQQKHSKEIQTLFLLSVITFYLNTTIFVIASAIERKNLENFVGMLNVSLFAYWYFYR